MTENWVDWARQHERGQVGREPCEPMQWWFCCTVHLDLGSRGQTQRGVARKGVDTAQDAFVCIGSRPKRFETVPTVSLLVCLAEVHPHPYSMIHLHQSLSFQSILQLARILSLTLLEKFPCAVHVRGSGLVAWLNHLPLQKEGDPYRIPVVPM